MKIYICKDYKNARWRKKIAGDEKLSLAFARLCVCDYIGRRIDRVNLKFDRAKYGKPFIKKISRKDGGRIDRVLHFSLSHSGDMLICAVARYNIGADCQLTNIKDINICKKIAARFYSPQELLLLDGLTELNYIDKFFEIWAKKEAYVKYTGKGLSEGLSSFSVAGKPCCVMADVYFTRVAPELSGVYIYICCGIENKDKLRVYYIK